jgi:hypothetical protein
MSVRDATLASFLSGGESSMSRIPAGKLIWSLRRYTGDGDHWDHLCGRCKQTTSVFEHEHRDEQERPAFGYLCEGCAHKKLAE